VRRLRAALAAAAGLGLGLGVTAAAAPPATPPLTAAGAGLRAPAGIRADVYARGVPRPTALALDARGRIWAASSAGGPGAQDGVWLVAGPGARPRHVVKGLHGVLGLTWAGGRLYVSSTGRVDAFSGLRGLRFTRRRAVLKDLPTGLHQNDAVVPGPDGRLYLGIGSPCNACRSEDPRSAAVVSFRPDGSDLRVVARGFRNPYGLAFLPGTRHLLVTENGRDDLGVGAPPDELNLVRIDGPVRDYGYPACWGQGGPPCRGTAPALADLAPHASADGIAVVSGWPGYGTSAFIAEFGSSFRPPTGHDVVRVALSPDGRGGYRARASVFATGFEYPLAAAADSEGSLLVGDFGRDLIYRLRPR
jgi:glucose/arabinose dehydrogenase